MSSHRLFRFQKPEWLNSPNTRTAGVYISGALVRLLPLLIPDVPLFTLPNPFLSPLLHLPLPLSPASSGPNTNHRGF